MTPDPLTETTAEYIARMERDGMLDPNCKTCRDMFYPVIHRGLLSVFAPSHKASRGCESGKRPHCTCDVCW